MEKNCPFLPGGQVDEVTEITTEGLGIGFHTLYIRLMDNAGIWSMAEGRPFFIDKSFESLATIVAAEYFIDESNPAPGNGTSIAIEPGSTVDFETQIDISGLALGEHRLNLRLQDNKGAWSYTRTKEFTIANPSLDNITPKSGGNTGLVTVTILGASFDEGTVVKFSGNGLADIVVPDSMMSIINGEQIRAMIDLKDKTIGLYNVELTLADGTILSLPNSFRVEEGIEAAPWAEVIGFDRIRPGQWQTYTITYGNKGNVDALGVPLNIVIGLDTLAEVKLDFELDRSSSYGEGFPYDSIPVFFNTDRLFSEPYLAKFYPLFISNIPANSINTINIQIKTNVDIELLAYTDAPYYNEQTLKIVNSYAPLELEEAKDRAGTIGGRRLSIRSDFNTNVAGCLTTVVEKIIDAGVEKMLPGVGCFISGYELTSEIIDLKQGKGEATRSSALWKMASTIKDCSLDFFPAGKIGKVSKVIFEGIMQAKDAEACSNTAYQSFGPLRRQIKKIRVVNSFDPNDKIGSVGAGSKVCSL